jgi:hypothetical protein
MNIHLGRLIMLIMSLAVAPVFALIGTVPSTTTEATTLLAENAYAPTSSNEVSSSSIPTPFETNSNESSKKDGTQMLDEDNNTRTGPKLSLNNTLFFKNQFRNETGLLSNITDIINITGISNAGVQGSPKVSGDFNGDGSDDLAIGVPYEDEEIGGSTEMELPVASVTASGNDGNVPLNVLDNNLSTRWSSLGIGQFIIADLGSTQKISDVDIAWYKGDARKNHFVIATSTDGTTYTNRLNRDSSGTTMNSESYNISPINARYVKIIVNGNTQNNWASITELHVFGPSPFHTVFDSGAVNVIYGSSKGLSATSLSPDDGRPDQIWTQAVLFDLEPYDAFGSALAIGDFNKDGFSDLAIGIPREDVNLDVSTTIPDAGAVNVIYGSSNGLSATGNQIFTQNYLGFPHNARAGDWFGYALTTGDFNNDTITDLAVGVPREDVNTHHGFMIDAGEVDIIYGAVTGLNDTNREDWTQYTPLLQFWWDDAEPGDWFGATLAAGDFNKDGYSELAIGVPREDVGTVRDAGQVNLIYYGIPTGAGLFLQTWTQNSTDIVDVPDSDDEFSSALATGDFNKDGYSDLAIGVLGEDVNLDDSNTVPDAGAVNVIYGSLNGLLPLEVSPGHGQDNQLWTQNSPGIEEDAEDGDVFGDALATGDFNIDGYSDLAIGAPAEDVGTVDLVGTVNVIYGSSHGLNATGLSLGDGRADQIWTQNSTYVEDNAESIDLFGFALTTGDFNNDTISDLAIGVPLEDVVAIGNAGAVNVIYGSVRTDIHLGGLSPTIPPLGIGHNDQIWNQTSIGIEDSAETSDNFGSSLG